MAYVKELHHFTSYCGLKMILMDGFLNLTPSNILQPTDLRKQAKTIILDGKKIQSMDYVSKTDTYKPVVWLTSTLNGNNVGNTFKDGDLFDKTRIRITVKMNDDYILWSKWDGYAEMETAWQKNVKRGAKDWRNFYICEHKIPVSEIIEVYDKFERKYIDISAGADSITIKR